MSTDDYGYRFLVAAYAVGAADNDGFMCLEQWTKKFLGFPPSPNPTLTLVLLIGAQGIPEPGLPGRDRYSDPICSVYARRRPGCRLFHGARATILLSSGKP